MFLYFHQTPGSARIESCLTRDQSNKNGYLEEVSSITIKPEAITKSNCQRSGGTVSLEDSYFEKLIRKIKSH